MKNEMMAMMIQLLMDVPKAVLLMMAMLVQEDQLQHQILALSAHQLQELYQVIKEVEILFEVMG